MPPFVLDLSLSSGGSGQNAQTDLQVKNTSRVCDRLIFGTLLTSQCAKCFINFTVKFNHFSYHLDQMLGAVTTNQI